MIAHTCTGAGGIEAGGSEIQDHLQTFRKFEAKLASSQKRDIFINNYVYLNRKIDIEYVKVILTGKNIVSIKKYFSSSEIKTHVKVVFSGVTAWPSR